MPRVGWSREIPALFSEWRTLLGRATRLGLGAKSGRWAEYERFLTKLAVGQRAGRQIINPPGMSEAFEAISQHLQLSISSRVWQQLDQALLKGKLRIIGKGPSLPRGSDISRDTLLELVAAALAAEKGYPPQLTDQAEDVRLHLDNGRYIVFECKRPSTEKAIDGVARSLNDQLERRYMAGAAFGIPVVGLDRLVFEETVYETSSMDHFHFGLKAHKARWISSIQKRLRERLDRPHLAPISIAVLSGGCRVHQPAPAVVPFCSAELFSSDGSGRQVPDEIAGLRRWPKDGPLSQILGGTERDEADDVL
jgi:hypothetical protein